jgi:hypothetical protein
MKANCGVPLCAEVSLRGLAYTLVTFSLLAATECLFVPVRLPTQTKGVSGKSQKVDFTFLKLGSTTRDEVDKHLAVIDTGVKQKNLFWGRWESSTWGYGMVGLDVPPGGDRYWRIHNLLIQFDPNGVVHRWVVADDKKLGQQIDIFDDDTAGGVNTATGTENRDQRVSKEEMH